MPDPRGKDTWILFKIMAEFVEGFETLRPVWPAISIFGSARLVPGHRYYADAVRVSNALSNAGFSIITGGGPGIMEAANLGASQGKSKSIGLNIKLPLEQAPNRFADTIIHFQYFFARKVMFVRYACAFVGLPGGFGTLDEIFEALTLRQTEKIHDFPVILFGTDYWSGLIDWLRKNALREGTVSASDMDLIRITDDVDELVEIIEIDYAERKRRRGPRSEPGHELP